MTTEELKVKITLDTSQLNAGVAQAKRQVTGLNQTMRGTSGATAEVNNSIKQVLDNLKEVKNLNVLDLLTNKWDKVAESINIVKKQIQLYRSAMRLAGQEIAGAFNFSGFREGLSSTERGFQRIKAVLASMKIQFKESGSSIRSAVTSAQAAVKQMGDTINQVIPPSMRKIVALVAAFKLLTSAIKNSISTAQRIKQLNAEASKIGLSANAYQKWGYVLDQVGVGVDKLTDFVRTLTDKQKDVISGSEDTIAAFKQLGLTAEQVSQMSQEELFKETVSRLQAIDDQITKTNIAYRIFGEDAAQLANIINMSSAECAALANNVQALGATMSGDLIVKSKNLANAIANLKLAWQGLTNTLAQIFMPIITTVVEWLTKAIIVVNLFLKTIFGIDTGAVSVANKGSKAMGGYTSSINKATQAVEKLKRTTMGFDELNIVNNPNNSSGSAGANAGLPSGIGGFDTSSFDTANTKLQEFYKKVEAFFAKWGGLIRGITLAMAGIFVAKHLKTWGAAIVKVFKTLNALSLGKLLASLGKVGKLFSILKTGLKLGGLGSLGAGAAVIAALAAVALFLKRNWEGVTQAFKNFFSLNIAPKLEKLKAVWQKLCDAVKNLLAPLKKIWDTLKSSGVLKTIISVIEAIGGVIFGLATGPIAGAVNSIIAGINGIIEMVTGAVEIVSGVINFIVSLVTLDFQGMWDAIKQIFGGVKDFFVGLWDTVIGSIVAFFEGIINWFNELGAVIDNVLNNIWMSFKQVWASIGNWFKTKVLVIFTKEFWVKTFDTIKQGMKSAMNGVIGVVENAVNWIVRQLNKLHWNIPDWVPLLGGKSFGFNIREVHIPRLATGGIATRSVVANIGENGTEAILPLDKNTGWMDKLANKISNQGTPSKIVLMVGEKELGWATINSINDITRQTGGLQLKLV